MTKQNDVFLPLQHVAYCRSRLTDLDDAHTRQELLDFCKWQICKVRNILFLDPIWDRYTEEDIFVEYFAIKFDESDEMAEEFKNKLGSGNKEEVADWFDQMAEKYATKTEEFEDTYD
jgi:hypothetical protein